MTETLAERTASSVIRLLAPTDSIDRLTALLNAAYAPLAADGMNFSAATQTAGVTAERIAEGCCFVAVTPGSGDIVGTVTVCGPWDAPVPQMRGAAHVRQLAVRPEQQRQGVGRRLLAACDDWARAEGHACMVLDTADRAAHLRALYRRAGYTEVGSVQWHGKTYRSVVLRKPLVPGACA